MLSKRGMRIWSQLGFLLSANKNQLARWCIWTPEIALATTDLIPFKFTRIPQTIPFGTLLLVLLVPFFTSLFTLNFKSLPLILQSKTREAITLENLLVNYYVLKCSWTTADRTSPRWPFLVHLQVIIQIKALQMMAVFAPGRKRYSRPWQLKIPHLIACLNYVIQSHEKRMGLILRSNILVAIDIA